MLVDLHARPVRQICQEFLGLIRDDHMRGGMSEEDARNFLVSLVGAGITVEWAEEALANPVATATAWVRAWSPDVDAWAWEEEIFDEFSQGRRIGSVSTDSTFLWDIHFYVGRFEFTCHRRPNAGLQRVVFSHQNRRQPRKAWLKGLNEWLEFAQLETLRFALEAWLGEQDPLIVKRVAQEAPEPGMPTYLGHSLIYDDMDQEAVAFWMHEVETWEG